jgi:SAM-dependent methyltransferase
MVNGLKLQYQKEPLLILEAGAGAGGLAKEVLQLNGLSLEHLYVTDIADGMLQQAQTRLQGMEKLTVEHADCTQFQYDDSMFHRYYCNMCLHYADDPDRMIRECHRVLKKDGICGFTIWGRREDSPLFTIVPDVLQELELSPMTGSTASPSSQRTGFWLGQDDVALRQRFQAFAKCLIHHVPIVIECLDANNFVEIVLDGAASTKKHLESLKLEDQVRVRNEVRKRAQSLLDQGIPIAIDTIVIIAQK